MRLVYKDTKEEVKIGDHTVTFRGEPCIVKYFDKPHKPNSEGHVTVHMEETNRDREFYCGVIGTEWIERDDRE